MLPKAYEPQTTEGRLYDSWLKQGLFTPRVDQARKPFVIIMPPPNVTGELHVGHGLTAAIEDILVRWRRMLGEPALWLPGVDHASIAAQNVVEKMLAQEGLTRHQLGREKFLERMWQWTRQCRGVITRQHQRLGTSCDWGRERFTLDEGPSRAVRTTFARLFQKGLIYRGERIIHWCPRCTTAISDLEVEHKESQGHLWYVRYPLEGGGSVSVATTRPETILGDTAVAVNPGDERYRDLVGRRAVLPAVGRSIPIIADEAVDKAFGTGAVKVTPAHDPVDFEIGQRHGLPHVNILNPDGTMNENAGPYRGLDRYACRRQLVADLERQGQLLKTEPHTHALGHCQRCGTVVEPWASRQWFVRTQPLAQPAIEAVADGRITIIPERFTKVYLHWMENIQDWCISRQLWWGHRIPVWYCAACQEVSASVADLAACPKCGSRDVQQDPDVLDTWFSSALWPHSTLGWPDDTPDFRYFYPTTVMETGYDILFFWVARMIMMGLENTGQVPFTTVYLHGLVRDEKGDKMSKSRGNVINPVAALEQYGTDALRFALTTGTSPGNDLRLTQQKLEAGRNFANKLWNAARFVLSHQPRQAASDFGFRTSDFGFGVSDFAFRPGLPVEDRWVLSRLQRCVTQVANLLKSFQIGEAEREIHDFLWGDYCDWYVELSKLRLRAASGPSPLPVLVHVLETSLRLLHPFMPFVTEEVWQALKAELAAREWPSSIMIAPYPTADERLLDAAAEAEIAAVIEVIQAIRQARAEARVEANRTVPAVVAARDRDLTPHLPAMATLARAQVRLLAPGETPPADGARVVVLRNGEVYLPEVGPDPAQERLRLEKELSSVAGYVARLETRLADDAYRSRAPAAVVARDEASLQEARERKLRIEEKLRDL